MDDPADSPKSIAEVDDAIHGLVDDFAKTCTDGTKCYPFLFIDEEITTETVDRVFDDLRQSFGANLESGRLAVIVASPGGDINAAYNLALLFRQYGNQELTFVVPRWAKSAATLIVCGGDRVMMTQVAELGPIDPQITDHNPLELRVERFSPLHIESTFVLDVDVQVVPVEQHHAHQGMVFASSASICLGWPSQSTVTPYMSNSAKLPLARLASP